MNTHEDDVAMMEALKRFSKKALEKESINPYSILDHDKRCFELTQKELEEQRKSTLKNLDSRRMANCEKL